MALYSIKSSRLPSKGDPGSAYYCTDTKDVFYAIADGVLLNLSDIFSGAKVARVVGPQGARGLQGQKGDVGPAGNDGTDGRDGKDGAPGRDGRNGARGEKGEAGAPGNNGKDGRDGKDGKPGMPGKQGEKGDPGDLTILGDAELKAAVEKLRAQRADLRARIIDKLQTMGDHPTFTLARMHLEDLLKP